MTIDIDYWSDYLLDAVANRSEVAAITKSIPDLTTSDAYDIQDAAVDKRLETGDRIIGAKLGLTSNAKQKQMGVDEPVYGWLMESGRLAPETPIRLDEFIHPRCEPEIVFTIGEDIEGPGISAGDIIDATTAVTGGIEVIDARYERFSFQLADTIADNTSAARYRLGTKRVDVTDLDLALLGCVFKVNGDITATAAGAALLGDPAHCVAMLANHLADRGRKIGAGWTVLAGALTDAVQLAPGTHARADYAHLGSVELTTEKD